MKQVLKEQKVMKKKDEKPKALIVASVASMIDQLKKGMMWMWHVTVKKEIQFQMKELKH